MTCQGLQSQGILIYLCYCHENAPKLRQPGVGTVAVPTGPFAACTSKFAYARCQSVRLSLCNALIKYSAKSPTGLCWRVTKKKNSILTEV